MQSSTEGGIIGTVKALRKRLEETVGKEAIDSVAQTYAAAYDGTGLTTEEIWEELICDSLGDMNIFGRDKAQKELFDRFIPDVKKVVSELKTEAKSTEGVTEGKASRNLSHRNKRLYVFPPYNESQSDANERATRWAHRADVEAGDSRVIAYHGQFYLIEKFDSSEMGYQIVDQITKQQYYEYIKEYGEDGTYIKGQSGKESVHTVSTLDRGRSGTGGRKHSSTTASYGQRGEDLQVQQVGENEAERRQDTGNRSRSLQSSDQNKQKYSRELDLIDYINEKAKVERENMTKAQLVAKIRAELEGMNVGTAEIMAVQKMADRLYERYGGDASISEFRQALFEATRLALSKDGYDASFDIIDRVAREFAYNPKNIGSEAELLSQIKKEIRGAKLSNKERYRRRINGTEQSKINLEMLR